MLLPSFGFLLRFAKCQKKKKRTTITFKLLDRDACGENTL